MSNGSRIEGTCWKKTGLLLIRFYKDTINNIANKGIESLPLSQIF